MESGAPPGSLDAATSSILGPDGGGQSNDRTRSTTGSYPLPAYLNFVPGGVEYPRNARRCSPGGQTSWTPQPNSARAAASIRSPSKRGNGGGASTSSGSTPNHWVPLWRYEKFGPGSAAYALIQRAVDADTSLRRYALQSHENERHTKSGGEDEAEGVEAKKLSKDAPITREKTDDQPPHLLPSLSVLAESVFGPLTGASPENARKWADALVLAYIDRDDEDDIDWARTEQKKKIRHDQSGAPEPMKLSPSKASNPDYPVPSNAGHQQEPRDVPSLLKEMYSKSAAAENASSPSSPADVSSAPRRPCGYVFRRGDIAWNCRTCQTDSTCVICDACFRASDHTGHDVFFHRTTPGGCCDCGDAEAWRPEGCCPRHRPEKRDLPGDTDDQMLVDGVPNAANDEEEAVRASLRGRSDGEAVVDRMLPPRLAAALGTVIGAAVGALLRAADGAGVGCDPVQWDARWDAQQVQRLWDRAPTDDDYSLLPPPSSEPSPPSSVPSSSSADETVQSTTTPDQRKVLPAGFRLRLRLHNDDVHTFDEVIEALCRTSYSRNQRREPTGSVAEEETQSSVHGLVQRREEAEEMTHKVDSDGQVPVRTYETFQGARAGFDRLKNRGLHCSVVTTAQIDLEARASALIGWLSDVAKAHPAGAAILVHALVDVTESTDSFGSLNVPVWRTARIIPSWSYRASDASADSEDQRERLEKRFGVFPPHLATSFLSRSESRRLMHYGYSSGLYDPETFVAVAGADAEFYATLRESGLDDEKRGTFSGSERYVKSPHALWGALSLPRHPNHDHPHLHPLLAVVAGVRVGIRTVKNSLLDRLLIVDTDLRKQQEADKLTSCAYPHHLTGLRMIPGRSDGNVSTDVDVNFGRAATSVLVTNAMSDDTSRCNSISIHLDEWRCLVTSSFRAPASAILLLLLLDPYPPKVFRVALHDLFLSLLVDSRFKSRFAAALGGVAYRALSTLFCAGVGTEADTALGFTVQVFTAGSLVRALGSASATRRLLCCDDEEHDDLSELTVSCSDVGQSGFVPAVFTVPISHCIVRCIHTNLLGATKEVKMVLNNTPLVGGNTNEEDSHNILGRNETLQAALTYQAHEHPMTTPLPAASDDGFLDSRSTRHKRLPHLLRDLEYVFETPGTALRLLLRSASTGQPMPPLNHPDHTTELAGIGWDVLTFPMVWARLLRMGQGIDPQKRKISGGHVEYEQNRWLEAFGLSLNFGGARDALAEAPLSSSSVPGVVPSLSQMREAVGNLFSALLQEIKLWLYREGLLDTGLPLPASMATIGDMGQLEALQRSTLHVSSPQPDPSISNYTPDDPTSGVNSLHDAKKNKSVNAVAVDCATGVKMTEAQLELIESALLADTTYSGMGPLMGDWLRVPHSPLAGDCLSFHLPLHRALARSIRSLCGVVIPEDVRTSDPMRWWQLPVLDDDSTAGASMDIVVSDPATALQQHYLCVLLKPMLRPANCRVVWSAGPDCSPAEAQMRRLRSRTISSAIASAKVIHSLCDHPLRCLAAAQQIERHLWARNGSSAAGMAYNYATSPLCRSFRDLDLSMVQFSSAGFSVGLGPRRTFSLLISRFSMDGYLADPERRGGAGNGTSGYGGAGWVNPPRLQDSDHAVALAESLFTTVCLLVTELPPPPPTSVADDSALRRIIRRELLHALAVEPKSFSEAMAAASGAVTRREETEGTPAGRSKGAVSFRNVFGEVLEDVGRPRSQGGRSSGAPSWELKATTSDEYDPTFFHLKRHEHQQAMDNVARLRRQKLAGPKGGSGAGISKCLPLVALPPRAHPRFRPCRLMLHLQALDAALRRALLFALFGGRWLPPSEPKSDSIMANLGDAMPGQSSEADKPSAPFGAGMRFARSTPSASTAAKKSDKSSTPFSPSVVAASSVSFLEALQLLTLQAHTLEECSSLHKAMSCLDSESRALSADVSADSYLSRLIYVPPSLTDVWALRCFPDGPLPSKGSGTNRGSILGLMIALYEHRADHASNSTSGEAGTDDGHGGARALVADGLKWLLRFVNALADGVPTIGDARESAREGVRKVSDAGMECADKGMINQACAKAVREMLQDLPNLWPKKEESAASGSEGGMSAKSKEARKAAQQRALERMRKQQASFAASLEKNSSVGSKGASSSDLEEEDLCIICRCDDADGENNGPLGFLGHLQRSRTLQLRTVAEIDSGEQAGLPFDLHRMYRVIGDRGCQLRATEAMDSSPVACLPVGSIVKVLEGRVSPQYRLLSRRVLVQHFTANGVGTGVKGWASVQSSQGYVILTPLAHLCYTNSRWGSTRPIIRQCGHAAHLKCVETHCLSLHQRAAGDQPYDGRFAANIEDGEFLCPLCKQLSNVLVPKDGGTAVIWKPIDRPDSSDRAVQPIETIKTSLTRRVQLQSGTFDVKVKATLEFGDCLMQAMQVPQDWTVPAKKKQQERWHPALRRWDFREEDLDGSTSGVPTSKVIGNIMLLLRQLHIGWASVGHSAASAEASARYYGLRREGSELKSRSFTGDPWTDYDMGDKDSHPMLLELRRTLTATSSFLEVLSFELSKQLGRLRSTPFLPILSCLLANVMDGRMWFNSPRIANSPGEGEDQWAIVTSLLAAMPCHVAKDGMLSPRHQARATAASMWAVKGLEGSSPALSHETSYPPDQPDYVNVMAPGNTSSQESHAAFVALSQQRSRSERLLFAPPAPLAVRRVCDGSELALPAGWGTLSPNDDDDDNKGSGNSMGVPFRPAVGSGFFYVPLLAWDLNTLAGGIFSSLLSFNSPDSYATAEVLLNAAHVLLVARLVQSVITPSGFRLDGSSALESDERPVMNGVAQRTVVEGSALVRLILDCRSSVGMEEGEVSHFQAKMTATGSLQAEDAWRVLRAVGDAVLPFARTIVLLLRAASSATRDRQRRWNGSRGQQTRAEQTLDALVQNFDAMNCDDAFSLLEMIGAPLPNSIMVEGGDSHWIGLIKRWLETVKCFETFHGSQGRSCRFDRERGTWAVATASDNLDKTMSFKTAEDAGSAKEESNVSIQPSAGGERTESPVSREVDDEVMGNTGVQENVGRSQPGLSMEMSFHLMNREDAMDDDDEEDAEQMDVDVDGAGGGDDLHVAEGDTDDGAVADGGVPLMSRGDGNDADSCDSPLSPSDAESVDKDFACVSSSPIIPFQPSLLKISDIGAGPRGAEFDVPTANRLMSDLSHLGMIHRTGSQCSGLIRLPSSFVDLYGLVNRVRGRDNGATLDETDDGATAETAICLLTGTIMRSGASRRRTVRSIRPPGACTLHARKTGSGIGVFFLLQKCTVLLMHNNKSAYSASLYVDEHGEEDPGLRRGRPLYLKEERYEALEALWRQHGIPREVAQIRSTSDRVIRDNWY